MKFYFLFAIAADGIGIAISSWRPKAVVPTGMRPDKYKQA